MLFRQNSSKWHFRCKVLLRAWRSLTGENPTGLYEFINVAGSVKEIWHLTHWSWNKIAAVLETTFSNVFSSQPCWKKNHWGLFLKAKLIMDQYRSSSGLVTLSVPSQYLHWWWLDSLTHICMTYAPPSLNAIYIIYQVIYMWIWHYVVKTILVYPYDLFTTQYGGKVSVSH